METPNNRPDDNIPDNTSDAPEAPNMMEQSPAAPSTPPEDPLRMEERLERLGGEPAPAITPEEFARLQRAGQVHIDARGRVRTARRSDAEAGVSLRKRRAWYGTA
ncbi:MAG: hypothetical protein JNJ61_16810 [Anaerolineae bacterium]|nr:hypothetical protein [Anaerolineae bacterium]